MLGGGARRPPSAPISTCMNAASFPNPSFPSQEPIPEPPFALSRVCDERRCAPPCDNPCGSGRTLSSTKEMKVFKCWKRSKTMQEIVEKKDVYARITSQIVAQLEKGVRPWSKPWNAEHAAGRITRPLRHNGQPYSGINILSLWMSAELQGFAAPIWMTFRQALELDAHGQISRGAFACSPSCWLRTGEPGVTIPPAAIRSRAASSRSRTRTAVFYISHKAPAHALGRNFSQFSEIPAKVRHLHR
jgi:hypothetical protein